MMDSTNSRIWCEVFDHHYWKPKEVSGTNLYDAKIVWICDICGKEETIRGWLNNYARIRKAIE